MDFIVDSDFHIHSSRSFCSRDPEQTPRFILDAAEKDGFREICLTNHFWDSDVPGIPGLSLGQNYDNIKVDLPLPQSDNVKFHFGCETDLDLRGVLGVAPENFDKFELILVSTTHMHLMGFTVDESVDTVEKRAKLYVKRLETVLNMDLPFHKVGMAHLTTDHITRGTKNATKYTHLEIINSISDETFNELFSAIREKGSGVELNFNINYYDDDRKDEALRPYRIAKECGCKFYLGSDAHHPRTFTDRRENFERNVRILELTENDKFNPFI